MKNYREACAWVFVMAKPMGWKVGPVVIDVEYRSHRGTGLYLALDVGNAMASIKPLVDGMVDAGIVGNDSKHWLSWGSMRILTTEREVERAGGPGVFVTVTRT